MASGLPVVARRGGGRPDIFSDENIGILVLPRELDKLTDAMLTIATTPSARLAEYGENALRRTVGQFRAERMRNEYELLYEECFRSLER